MKDLTQQLEMYFGLTSFRQGQVEVISHLLAGRSALAVFPTGGGKSLCYQFPAVLLPGLTLVVSPLLALMKEQVDRLVARGISAERLDSTLSAEETSAVIRSARSGQLKLLFVAPERFNNERFREMLRGIRISLFAVDEAHCISEWGHNFRPDYLKLKKFAENCGAERLLALTATATPQVIEDICRDFQISKEAVVHTGFYRPNLTLLITNVSSQERDLLLVQRIKSREKGATIIYVTLQRTAENVADLCGGGVEAYHAGMKDEERVRVQEWFMSAENPIVVATIAFGMGIDKADIRYVYHYNMPKSLENYSQEIGRAGRDGQRSTCEVFICMDDVIPLENFVYGDTPSLAGITKLLSHIFSLKAEISISIYDLSISADIRQIVIKTILTYLELEGYLEARTPVYSVFKCRFLAQKTAVFANFQGERLEFLENIFRCARVGTTWHTLDIEEVLSAVAFPGVHPNAELPTPEHLVATRDRVIRALDYLVEKGWLEMKAEGLRNRFRVLQVPSDSQELARNIYMRLSTLEKREVARVHQVLELAVHDGCQVAKLSSYFGETFGANCGHCSWCLNAHGPMALPERRVSAVSPTVWSDALEFSKNNSEIFSEPRVLARFLCGISSPAISKSRLTKHSLFGVLRDTSFGEVVRRLSNT